MPSLGERLKAARARAGFTQKDVEAKLGLRELSMKDYETERLKLPAHLAVKFAELYGVSVDELLGITGAEPKPGPQAATLGRVSSLFSRQETSLLFLDPVIRAFLEEHQEKVFDHSVFDLLTLHYSPREKNRFATELLRTLASLMGVDKKISAEESQFLRELIQNFGLTEHAKGIVKMNTLRYVPDAAFFQGRPEAKHLLLWLLFLIAKSDHQINVEEIQYIEECAETLKVNRSNYLHIKKFFVKEKY
jgi:transcriptional regulator with XRE-family HTH domain